MTFAPEEQEKRTPKGSEATYEPPAVIYEGTISTRAGSPTGGPAVDENAIDLFADPDE
jgi:hypothetical protein